MDWPLIGALSGVTALAGVVGTGAFLMLSSAPPKSKAVPQPPVLLVDRRPARTNAGRVHLASLPTMPLYTVPELHLAPAPRPIDNQPPAGGKAAWPPANNFPDAARYRIEKKRPASPKPHKPVERASHGVDQRYGNVLTTRKIGELRGMLHLLPDQRLLWPPVEDVLRKIGHGQLAQIKRGEYPEVDSKMMMSLYWAAQPLLASLHPQQKERVRALARSLGYANVASML